MAQETLTEKRQPSVTTERESPLIAEVREDPDTPPGWTYNPSAWSQRLPILGLAILNAVLAGYLAACEIGWIHHAWDPFFGEGTMQVLNSKISRAFPVPDAALGAGAYLLEALSCLLGNGARWRTKPWLALTFGLLVLPLAIVSLVLLTLQPIVVHAWCTLCLIITAGMLVMVPLALDEIVATAQFLLRNGREGKSLWKVFRHGETGRNKAASPAPARNTTTPFRGFSIPWSLAVCVALGIWMLAAPSVLGTKDEAAVSDILAGAWLITFGMLACAEVARPLRLLCVLCGVWLAVFATWTFYGASAVARGNELIVGVLVMLCGCLRGRIKERYDGWNRYIV